MLGNADCDSALTSQACFISGCKADKVCAATSSSAFSVPAVLPTFMPDEKAVQTIDLSIWAGVVCIILKAVGWLILQYVGDGYDNMLS